MCVLIQGCMTPISSLNCFPLRPRRFGVDTYDYCSDIFYEIQWHIEDLTIYLPLTMGKLM